MSKLRVFAALGLALTAATAGVAPASAESGPETKAHLDVRDDGSWIIGFGKKERSGAIPFSDYCVGHFTGPRTVNNTLEWGAEQTCEGNSKPQYVRTRLQSTCPGSLCIVFPDETSWIRSPYREDYTRVSRVVRDEKCGNDNQRVYRIEVKPYARGIEFDSLLSDEKKVNCDISP
ncbi:hypothetical protein [Streptomyces fractus]|uniref:hypothetical protein n=1 Tax=Streptomyces fractus TaxID=641806 RepID=UPI003CF7632E